MVVAEFALLLAALGLHLHVTCDTRNVASGLKHKINTCIPIRLPKIVFLILVSVPFKVDRIVFDFGRASYGGKISRMELQVPG